MRNLPSGYHRDLQETKRPYLTALDTVIGQVLVMTLTIGRLQVSEAALERSLTPELYATDAAFALVQQGMAFRDAYRQAAQGDAFFDGNDAGGEATPPAPAAMAARTATGTAGNLRLSERRRLVAAERQRVTDDAARGAAALTSLMGRPVAVYRNPWGTGAA